MSNKGHNRIACLLILLFGFLLFYIGTDGFRAYTAETARVNQLKGTQPEFPYALLEDSNERTYSISEFEGKYVLITFMYTSCNTVCLQLEFNMGQVYDLIPSQYIGEDIVFLSISFDPERDDPATLNTYKEYFNSDGETWRMATVPDPSELQILIEAFGVIVIPDGNGNFVHNSAFYLVDREGKLVDVMDYQEVETAATTIISVLESEEGE
ncbi:SCO family protein [Alkalihalobacillus sp. BA299]|uniref:SCO family protein n=1 Tax=Alkalihalobacillus sp. BA299 TaxID=2815938 RepID=UPI001ADB0623|nr:SCO family protein [Alkalihalobacillus sp. BA299]